MSLATESRGTARSGDRQPLRGTGMIPMLGLVDRRPGQERLLVVILDVFRVRIRQSQTELGAENLRATKIAGCALAAADREDPVWQLLCEPRVSFIAARSENTTRPHYIVIALPQLPFLQEEL